MDFGFLVPCLSLLVLVSASASTALVATNGADGAGDGGASDNTTGFNFSTFRAEFSGVNLTVVGDASITKGALQITPDSLNNAGTFLTNTSGRVFYYLPFKLWHLESNGSKNVASFSTVFTINIFRPNGTEPAEGIAFLIAPSADTPPAGSYGGFLGLTNAATDGNSTNKIVAVELDTEKQPYDPDGNHIGLNVNSVVSVANASLTPRGIELSPVASVFYNVWIDYDGDARRISVYMAEADISKETKKPRSTVLAAPLDLGATVAEWSYFGFSASTGTKYEFNCVRAWNMTVDKLSLEDEPATSKTLGLAIGVFVRSLALVSGAALGYYLSSW